MKKLITSVGAALAIMFAGATSSFAYTVKQGDTLNGIARAHNTSLKSVIDANPQIPNPNRIFIGQNVNVSGQVQTSNTTQSEKPIYSAQPISGAISLSDNEKDVLARTIRAESESEPYSGKVAVGTVVLNRVLSDQFPDTVQSVVYQKGQFDVVSNGAINKPADSDSKRAAVDAISFVNSGQSKGALFFYNPRTSSSHWLDSKSTVTVIGNHVFKK